MRYGTIRRPTALTTDSLEGCILHATSAGSNIEIVVAAMKAPAVENDHGPVGVLPTGLCDAAWCGLVVSWW